MRRATAGRSISILRRDPLLIANTSRRVSTLFPSSDSSAGIVEELTTTAPRRYISRSAYECVMYARRICQLQCRGFLLASDSPASFFPPLPPPRYFAIIRSHGKISRVSQRTRSVALERRDLLRCCRIDRTRMPPRYMLHKNSVVDSTAISIWPAPPCDCASRAGN